MVTKKERDAIDDFNQGRAARSQAELDKRSHLVNPLTDPSNGDPPMAVSDQGDRMGSAPEEKKGA